jgi:hypothetical protein
MDLIDKKLFFQIISEFKIVTFHQSEGWLAFCNYEVNGKIIFLVDDISNPQMACFAHVKKAFGLKMLLIEDLCIKSSQYNYSGIQDFYNSIICLDFDIVEVNCILKYNSNYEIGIRRAGFLRPLGTFSVPLSNWINLQDQIRYNNNWKRNLKKANEHNLFFQVINKPSIDVVNQIINLYNQFTLEKGFSHRLNFIPTFKMLQSEDFSLGMVFNDKNEISCAIIFHHHAQHAGLLYAARRKSAKEIGSTFFMYDQLFKHLKAESFQTFDMEKIQPSTHSTDGVFLFKNGIKGEHVLYNGEWSWYKRKAYRPLMYLVKRYLMKKHEL